MTKPYLLTLNGMHLTKSSARKLIKHTLLPSTNPGDVLEEGTPFFSILKDLLSYHPESEKKIGVGVKCFHVLLDPVFKNKRFEIERIDGTRIDFSYLICIKGKSTTDKENALLALRHVIHPQIKAFKQLMFKDCDICQCAITGTPLSFKEASVDHKPPDNFRSLVSRFLDEHKISLSDIETIDDDSGVIKLVVDNHLHSSWYDFHKENAVLQITSLEANINQGVGK